MSTLIFNGQDLADFGVHISGEGTFNAPTRAVEEQIVPGRNGTLIIDGGRWENIIVTYPAYITDDFDDNMAALRSFLASVRGYARLADTYHPNEFRLACFSDEITVRTSGRYNAQGQFDLSFNCKPQRFLTSGEEVTTFDASDLPSESFSGNPATFETDGEYKVSELSVGITPVQSGTGDPSPTNIRPISGRTGMTVTAANKNLAPNMAGQASTTSNGITFTYNDDGSVTLNGTATGSAFSRAVSRISSNIRLPFGTYKKPVINLGDNQYIGLYVQYMESSSSWVSAEGGGLARDPFVIDRDIPLAIRVGVTSGTTVSNFRFEPYIYPESISDTTWESPVKREYSIIWESSAGTVYGGTLDVVSGVLTVDSYFLEPTANELTSAATNPLRIGIRTPNRPKDHAFTDAPDGLYCNRLKPVVRQILRDVDDYGIAYDINVNRLQMRLPDVASVAEAQTWLADNPLQIVYKLATPQTYNITPTEVKTLLGGNTIYTDAGGVDGKYLLPLRITNPTAFEAKPIIRIYGAGAVGIGDVNVTFDGSSEYVDLDCEIQDAYYGLANKNSAVTLNPNRFPVIPANGAEIVLGSGITQVDITPRWFEL